MEEKDSQIYEEKEKYIVIAINKETRDVNF